MDDVELAHRLATVATTAAAPYMRLRPTANTKPDGSPVTEADLAIEAALLSEVAKHRPDDEVLSEEGGLLATPGAALYEEAEQLTSRASSRRRWVLDPLDGTEVFLASRQAWGTHIALQVDGATVIGLITRPTQRRRWWARRGHGACTASEADNWGGSVGAIGRRLQVSDLADLTQARVGGFAAETSALARAVAHHAHWATDPLSPVLALAEGRLEAVVATGGQVWDHAPQVLLVTEAGGRFTDPEGGQRPDRGGGIYSNGRLDTSALRAAAWPGLQESLQ